MNAIPNVADEQAARPLRLTVLRRYKVPGRGFGVAVDAPLDGSSAPRSLVGRDVFLQWHGRGAVFRVKAVEQGALAAGENLGLWVEEIEAA